MKKLLHRLKRWWAKRQFRQQKPVVAERRDYLKAAIKQVKLDD